jgi:hypothetical protein
VNEAWENVIGSSPQSVGQRRPRPMITNTAYTEAQVSPDLRHELNNMRRRIEGLEKEVSLHKEWRDLAKNLFVRMVRWILPKTTTDEASSLAEEMGKLNVLDAQQMAEEHVESVTGQTAVLTI